MSELNIGDLMRDTAQQYVPRTPDQFKVMALNSAAMMFAGRTDANALMVLQVADQFEKWLKK